MPENGEWRQHHAGIRCAQFCPLPLTVNTWYPPMSKSASMGAVGSSSIRQGTSPTGVWGKRQADVRTSRVAYRRLWMSSGPSWPCHGRASGNTNWGFHLHMRESLWRWDFSMELSHSFEAIFMDNTHTHACTHTRMHTHIYTFGCTRVWRMNILTLPASLLPLRGTT